MDLKSCDWDVMCHIYIEMGFRKATQIRSVSASFLLLARRNYKDLTFFCLINY